MVEAMGAHREVKEVHENACGALCNVTVNNGGNQVRLAEAGGIEAVVAAMTAHREVKEVNIKPAGGC